MKNFTLNHKNGSIDITTAFEKKARIFGSSEYRMLVEAQQTFPTYRLNFIKSSKNTPTLKGLNYNYIRTYLDTHNDQEGITQFDALVEGNAKYGEIKKWFVERYPSFENYTSKADLILAA